MTEETQEIAPEAEATEEPVSIEQKEAEAKPEAAENTEGQEDSQPAESTDEDERSESQKRRDRRKAKMRELHEAAEAAKAKLAAAERRQQAIQERAAKSETPPKEDDFQDYNEYLIAMGAYHASRSLDGRLVEEVSEVTRAEQARVEALKAQQKQELDQAWADQVTDARTRYADFEQVAYTAPISDEVAEIVMTSDIGADIAYHLGQNREEALRLSQIAKFSPVEAAREVGRLEARLSLPKPNTQPSAPDPIKPVKPSSQGRLDPSKMSMAEYMAARKAGKI